MRVNTPSFTDPVSATIDAQRYDACASPNSVCAAVDKKELLKLQKEFHKLSRKNTDSDHTITRAQFAEALTIVGIRESGASEALSLRLPRRVTCLKCRCVLRTVSVCSAG